jgi:hypothetical protein
MYQARLLSTQKDDLGGVVKMSPAEARAALGMPDNPNAKNSRGRKQ